MTFCKCFVHELLIRVAVGERFCTYSSFPRKDVSLHTKTLVCFPEDTLIKGKLLDSLNNSQALEASIGVETWSELMDVRSVLRSNDVQDESEETEGLVSSFSSCHPSSRSMVREWQATRTWEAVKKKKGDGGRRRFGLGESHICWVKASLSLRVWFDNLLKSEARGRAAKKPIAGNIRQKEMAVKIWGQGNEITQGLQQIAGEMNRCADGRWRTQRPGELASRERRR